MKRRFPNVIIRQVLGVLISIMLITSQAGWAQVTQSGSGGSASQSQAATAKPQLTSTLRASSESQKMNVPQIILTKTNTTLRTKADQGTTSTSLVKIKDANGNVSDPIEWNDAFTKISKEGGNILLYQDVTLTNTGNILPSVDCTIDGGGHELHYTEGGEERTFILNADITFKNIKLFDGLVAWGNAVVFESDVTLAEGYSVWGGEFRNENHTVHGMEDYVVENTSITIKGGTFKNIYGGSSDGEITGSTYVKIEDGTFTNIYGGNSHPDAKAIPGNTEVIINGGTITGWVIGGGGSGSVTGNTQVSVSGGTISGNVCGGGLAAEVMGTANVTISGNANITNSVFGGGCNAPATVKNTHVSITGGSIGSWAFGGGIDANVTGDTYIEISGGTVSNGSLCGGCSTGDVTGTANVVIKENAQIGYSVYGGGETANAACGNTKVILEGGTIGSWAFGGGKDANVTGDTYIEVSGGTVSNGSLCGGCSTGDVTGTANVVIKENAQIGKLVCGGGETANAACGNTNVILKGGTIGSWAFGGGLHGTVTGTANLTVEGGTFTTVCGGGCNNDALCENTKVSINGGQVSWIYGGGENGNVTGNTQVIIEDGQIESAYGSGQQGTVGGDVNIIAKGGSMQILAAANTSTNVTGSMNITIEGGKTSFTGSAQINAENTADNYKSCNITFKDCGSNGSPYNIPAISGISKVILQNSFIKKDPTGQSNPAFMHKLSAPLTIEGTGMTGSFEVQPYGEPAATEGTSIVNAADLTADAKFTTNGYALYKVGNTYRYGGATPDYKTIGITHPDAAVGTLSVKLSDETELESGDQVPNGTTLTVTATPNAGYSLTIKNGDETITSGNTLTANADVNLKIEIAGSLDLSSQSTDITISKEGETWQYLAQELRSTGTTAFNGVVTGTLPNNKVIRIDGSANGELVFDNAKVDAGNTGTAITIAQGADITIKGSLEAKTSDSSAPAIANNGSISATTGASITATNSGDAAKGITVSEGAALVLTDGSTLTASGIDNATGGTVVAQEGSTVSNSTSGDDDLKTYAVTITNPGNGNTLTVQAGGIDITSGDKVTENTQLKITATPATNYSLEKITGNGNGNVTEIANGANYTMGTVAITIAASFKYNPPYVPVPTTYTVTLPEVEGATLSKKPGNHTVEEGYSLTFTITLDAAYSESVPVVTTDRSETIEPDASGRYKIGNVGEDIVVSITGIVRNIPTAIETVESGTMVWAANGTILVRTSAPQLMQVFSLAGSTVIRRDIPAGDTRIEGPAAGLYIVRLSDSTIRKVMIGK